MNRNVFKTLALYMIGFGLVIGIIFPFFVTLIVDVPSEAVLNPLFFILCLIAGFLVGLFNIFLARIIVGKRISHLSYHMKKIEKKLTELKNESNGHDCVDDNYYIQEISNDQI